MGNVSFSEFRANLAAHLDGAIDSRAPLLVTRRGKEDVIVLAASEYAGLMETLHLLRSPKNAARLLDSIREVDAGGGVEHELTER